MTSHLDDDHNDAAAAEADISPRSVAGITRVPVARIDEAVHHGFDASRHRLTRLGGNRS